MQNSESKHILIIDDSVDQQFLLKMILESKGYTTDCTSNGEEALQLLRTAKKMPHTILLDLNMPVMGGLAFRTLQRADPQLKDIPVVIMSGNNEMAATRAKTNTDVIMKPLTIDSLMAAVERNLYLH